MPADMAYADQYERCPHRCPDSDAELASRGSIGSPEIPDGTTELDYERLLVAYGSPHSFDTDEEADEFDRAREAIRKPHTFVPMDQIDSARRGKINPMQRDGCGCFADGTVDNDGLME